MAIVRVGRPAYTARSSTITMIQTTNRKETQPSEFDVLRVGFPINDKAVLGRYVEK